MRRGLAREARRRPDMDLLVGPLEAAQPTAPSEPAEAAAEPDPFDLDGGQERPMWRDDG